jgi:hypothetical protein
MEAKRIKMTHLLRDPIGNSPDNFSLGTTIEATCRDESERVIVYEKGSGREKSGGELLLGN